MTYTLSYVQDLHRDGTTINGRIDSNEGTIQIEESLCPQARRVTMWEEFLHGILVNAGYVGKHKEKMLAALASGIVLLLDENEALS